MKFPQGQRVLHQPNYNPPCNVYQPNHLLHSSKKGTGLATSSLPTSNTFGYQSRFQNNQDEIPGPGSYGFCSPALAQSVGKEKKPLKNRQYPTFCAVPSIPYSFYGQHPDEQEQVYVEQLLQNQNLTKASQKVKKKQPSFSFSKSQKNLSYLTKSSSVNNEQQYYYPIIQNQEANQINKKSNNVVWQQKIKKANEKRLKAIQSLDPDYVPSLELLQIIKKKNNQPIPGPGDYDNSNPGTNLYLIEESVKGFSFAASRRFSIDKIGVNGPGRYNPKDVTDTSKKFSFSREARAVFEKKDSSHFRFYINPSVDANANTGIIPIMGNNCPFGSNSKRFVEVTKEESIKGSMEEERKRKQKEKLHNIIQAKLKVKMRRNSEKEEGLLGISTMASTID